MYLIFYCTLLHNFFFFYWPTSDGITWPARSPWTSYKPVTVFQRPAWYELFFPAESSGGILAQFNVMKFLLLEFSYVHLDIYVTIQKKRSLATFKFTSTWTSVVPSGFVGWHHTGRLRISHLPLLYLYPEPISPLLSQSKMTFHMYSGSRWSSCALAAYLRLVTASVLNRTCVCVCSGSTWSFCFK